jgi:hypothetical protein
MNKVIMARSELVGRPRKHNREQIACDIIEWAKKDDSINLNKFCAYCDPPISPRKLSEWSKESQEFRESVETAKAFLAFRREEWLTKDMLHVKGYDLSASAYDYFIKEEKRDQAEFEALLKSKETNQVSEDIIEQYQAVMEQIKQRQSEASARKIADSNIKRDNKS